MTAKLVNFGTGGWQTKNGVSVKGTAYLNGLLLGPEELYATAKTISSEKEFISLLENLNGFFAIIIENENGILAAVDLARSIPLFYAVEDDVLYLSDKPEILRKELGSTAADEIVRLEFMLTGYVTGSDTLARGIKQLQAGEYLQFSNNRQLQTARYFTFSPSPNSSFQKAELWEGLDRVYAAAAERLVHWAGGRTIVIPLSGGYDSRFLAVLLKQTGYENIFTYTYGMSKSAEVMMAQEVARLLGLPCTLVEYTNEAWWQWFHSPEREAYFQYAHNLVSIPQIQDWPAVWGLRKDNLIPENAIIVPGYTANFVSGGHIPRRFCELTRLNKTNFVSEIFQKHYSLWQSTAFEPELLRELLKRIEAVSVFRLSDECSFEYAASKYETWEWQERQAKFIINAVRVYDFWNYDWWLPFFDAEVVRFWLKVPYEWRIGSHLYIEYAINKYAKAANISLQRASLRAPKQRVDRLTLKTAPYMAARYLFHLITTDKMRQATRKSNSYGNHPLAIYGIMRKEVFNKYRYEFRNYHSFISKYFIDGNYF